MMQTNKTYFEAFKYKAWANVEILAYGERQLHLLSEADRSFLLRILNHTAVVDSLFISRISGTADLYAADNTIETPSLSELRERMAKNDSWLIGFVQAVTANEL